jgi:2-dehydro-3-deoxyphosphogluconate aldolase/(4S)-4-hydroxy-2-oxoglutarate aldolase
VKSAIIDSGVIGIVRTSSAAKAVGLSRTIWAAGVDVVEVALTTPQGLEAVATLAAEADDGRIIGAGTVLDAATARMAVLAGAQLLVTPTLVKEVIEVGQRYGVLTAIGCSTPTEMLRATTLGADLIKVFPAGMWTPKILSDVLAALPQLDVVPTGGVSPESAASWIEAGARAVGLGSALTSGDDPAASVRAVLDAIAKVRSR